MNWNRLFFTASALLIALTGCVNREAQKQAGQTQEILNDPVTVVKTEPVKTSAISESLDLTGQLVSSEDSQIGAKASGKITAVYVKDGDLVQAGQVIASLDTSTQNSQLSSAMGQASSARSQLSQALANARVQPQQTSSRVAAAQAQLRSARAALAKAKAGARMEERSQSDWAVRSAKSNLETAKKELDRQNMLYGEGAGTKQAQDRALNAYEVALTQYNSALQSQLQIQNGTRSEDLVQAQEAVRSAEEALKQAQDSKKLDTIYQDQVQSAQAALQSAQAQVAIVQQAIADSQIRAPFTGRISGKPIQAGTVVAPGSPIVHLVGVNGLYFLGEIPEEAVSKVIPGNKVAVVFESKGLTIPGAVAAINPQGSEIGRLFQVRVNLNYHGPSLLPGMFGKGRIELQKINSAVMIPAAAIVKREGAEVVFVQEGEKAKMVAITRKLTQNDRVQVDGVVPGQNLIVQGQAGLVDGSKIRTKQEVAEVPAKKEL